jgi:hypothetical protein
MKVGETLSFQVEAQLWAQLVEIGQVTGEHPADVALTILRAGTETRVALMVQEAEAERFRLESELSAVQARLSGLNGSPRAPQSPVEPSSGTTSVYHYSVVRVAVKEVLGSDRQRTWTMAEILEALRGLGYETEGMYQQVNNTLRVLVTEGQARRPARGQYAWRRRPSQK